ncbi:cytochrome C [uncultured Campylobacter sp.]|uniref:cytochrome C n=1 Tax=uncultured Campylobacter sp. TaxID=218934 RepID=UPI0025E2763D|nr:cytochrome C [uncultured Campylobacter sp.]
MKRYQLYTILALILMTVGFTIPVIAYHGVANKIKNGAEIPSYVYPIYNLYTKIQYKNHLMAPEVRNDLAKMIETRSEIGVPSLPIWYVSLEAPNYPKEAFPDGIPVYFHVDGYSGDVHEMNTINHYIGMYPMEHGGNVERAIAPYYLLIATIFMLLYLYYNGKGNSLLLIPTIIAPILFMSAFVGWLYWYGHNMQEWGAFKIKPFMPTALGDGKVAQFTTHSYPTIGFWVMITMSVLSILAIFSKNKYLKENA